MLVSKGLNETLNLKKDILTVDGRKRIVDTYKVIMATLGPKEMWFGKNGKGASVFTTSNKDYGISMSEGGAGAAAFNQLKQDLIDIRDDENYTLHANCLTYLKFKAFHMFSKFCKAFDTVNNDSFC